MTLPIALTVACVACVFALIGADRRDWPAGRAVFKLGASTAFVALALALGALQSRYGQWVLGALLLGWLGDALLLSRRSGAFMAGIGVFLLSHLMFAAAFASGALAWHAMGVALVLAVAIGAALLRWLWPHTPTAFRWPVLAYVVVILAMCVTATGHAFAHARGIVLLGALLFAVSDIAVARDRFVRPSPLNHLWGWPTYFAAQLVLAWSVVGM
jgi:uncharacterized membrane protein YhhN